MGESARYLYAVCRGLPITALDGVVGIYDDRLEVLGALDLDAVVSTIDLDDFSGGGLRAHLDDPAWVARTARRHGEVVRACAAAAPTAPMGLATVGLDDVGVRLRVEAQYGDLVLALERTLGRQEYRVKVYAHPARTPAARCADPTAAAEVVDRELCGMAVEARHRRPPAQGLAGHGSPMLLDGAYLVDDVAARSFAGRVAELVAAFPDVSIACDGPAPPYAFAALGTPER